MRQIVRHRPDAGENRNQMSVRVSGRELDGLRWRRRLSPQERGIEIEKSDDEGGTTVQRRMLKFLKLKPHVVVAKKPGLALQPADECRQVALVFRAPDLAHDKRLPRSDGCRVREVHR